MRTASSTSATGASPRRSTPSQRGRGHTLLELAFGWLIGKAPVASVIAGASTPEQVEQNVRAAAWQLSAEDMAEADRITG